MRARFFFFVLPCLALAGCGGGGTDDPVSCTTDIVSTPSAAYAGSFTGSFTPTGSTSVLETLNVSVSTAGVVTGTYDRSLGAGGGESGSVTGTATNVRNECDDTQAAIVLTLTLPTGAIENLTVGKTRTSTLPGRFTGSLVSDSATTKGTLVVAAVTPVQ